MAYQVLARKWRPKRFEEVVGQDHITRSLQNALRTGKLAHAYLFTGTRGVGKTTIARLFGKAIRCEARGADMNPCLECVSCKDIEQGYSLDYLEIDGASNNSVDDVRELIENARYLPARGTHKIYVIDEVHMLSTAAFNALLKTLEEPPAHAIFVFATTDPHKLLGTVLSRCQRFDFKSVPPEILAGHLRKVAQAEGIRFSDPRLVDKLAVYGKGSVRDALSLFDQVLSLAGGGVIDEAVFYQSLGLARAGALRDMMGHILRERPMEASRLLQDLLQENIDLKRIVDQLLEAFHAVIQLVDTPAETYSQGLLPPDALDGITFAELFWLFETFTKDCEWALVSPSPEKVVDLVLQKLARRRQILQPDHALVQKGAAGATASRTAASPAPKMSPAPIAAPEATVAPAATPTPAARPAGAVSALNPSYEALLESLDDAPTIRGNLEMGNFTEPPRMVEGSVRLSIGFMEEDSLPRDYLQDPEVVVKLKEKLARFYGVTADRVAVQFSAVTASEAAATGFTGISAREQLAAREATAQKKERLLNDPYVREAERLFGSKVDKVVLKD